MSLEIVLCFSPANNSFLLETRKFFHFYQLSSCNLPRPSSLFLLYFHFQFQFTVLNYFICKVFRHADGKVQEIWWFSIVYTWNPIIRFLIAFIRWFEWFQTSFYCKISVHRQKACFHCWFKILERKRKSYFGKSFLPLTNYTHFRNRLNSGKRLSNTLHFLSWSYFWCEWKIIQTFRVIISKLMRFFFSFPFQTLPFILKWFPCRGFGCYLRIIFGVYWFFWWQLTLCRRRSKVTRGRDEARKLINRFLVGLKWRKVHIFNLSFLQGPL